MRSSQKKVISIDEFASSFGTSVEEVRRICGEVISGYDFNYDVCSQKKREEIYLDIIKKCSKKEFSVSGKHRKQDWERGWSEILQNFTSSNFAMKSLIPKDVRGDRPLRFNGNYVVSHSDSFEHDFSTVFRTWLYKKYFNSFNNVYEFGCGTGHNLMLLANLFPGKNYFGADWIKESKYILEAASKHFDWKITGHVFDFSNPDYNLELLPSSVVYTSCALEQMGSNFDPFLKYLFEKKPDLIVNVEPLSEYYDSDKFFDYVTLTYHNSRNYLNGYLRHLIQLKKEGKIEILKTKRLGFGSMYHEGYSYVIWKIL